MSLLRPLQHRAVGQLGMVGLLPLAYGLVRDQLTLDAAATRALVLLVLLIVADRVVSVIAAVAFRPPVPRDRGPDDAR